MDDIKKILHRWYEKFKTLWGQGKIQRSSRITYDITWNIILFFIIIGVIGFFFAGGVGAGYFASLVKDEPVRSYDSMKKDIYNYEETSTLYFAENKYFGDIRSDIMREEVKLENVSDTLINAVIATEDRNFREHEGVVPKAILRAVVQEATNAAVKTGGSTLTQQLIKNQILTNEVSFERKAKEILLALRLERFFDKDEILEAYLNIVPYGREASGRNIAGIQTAAQGVFDVDAKDLNLPQAAFLAGLPQSPTYYTPFKNSGGLKSKEALQPGINRMKTVLARMYEADYITKEEYDKALEYDIVADFTLESKSPMDKYPYLMYEAERRAVNILSEQLAKGDGYTIEDINSDEKLKEEYRIRADRALRKNGYQIHTTIDKKTYAAFQEIVKNYHNYGPDRTYTVVDEETGEEVKVTEPVQTAGMLIENATGKIISFIGGRGYSPDSTFNYATRAKRSNGSTMKPLLDYAPAFENGIIQPGTPLADIRTYYGKYSPDNYSGTFHGLVSARKALAESYNVPALAVYNRLMNKGIGQKYLEKMGITTIGDKEYSNLVLGIGATTRGVTIEENINAYNTFANGGKFVDAYMIDKITTNDGEVIYEHKSEPVEVFSPQTSYLTLDILRDVIDYGTGTYLQSQLNTVSSVDWAGKSGTSEAWKDYWFIGTNPNITMGTWIGYETPYPINECSSCAPYNERNMKLWAKLVNKATEINPELMAPEKNFERPDGIVDKSYCAISGKLPSDLCSKAGLVYTDLFNAKYVPSKTDDSLITGSFVMVDGKAVVAGPKTPKEFVNGDGLTFNPEFLQKNNYDRLDDLTKLFPAKNRASWEKIGVPSGDIGSTIADDGKAPAAPANVTKSGSTLSWSDSSSKDVVGYRIYRASKPGASFSLVGNTTSTSYEVGGGNAVYVVKAVDYFGMESKVSETVKVGSFSKTEQKAKDPKSDKPAKSDKPDEPEKPDKPDKPGKPEDGDKPPKDGNGKTKPPVEPPAQDPPDKKKNN
ncbi:penicillin-binding protein [Virgibacillus phasianinus]|uniref:Penicillin-binding protein n=1 Tax=Virgibacillus phasianinus TaxID=2017483 RepID=A0A220U499_9BACI|nr:transglycosylase domain-containing protein [Virgibacillus phasianinus]ASK62937.1 penicillin-binding protein [Virgibacillus phasianinus]